MAPRIAHVALLKGREAAKQLDLEKLESVFVEWSGSAPFTSWESEALSGTKSAAGQTVDLSFAEVVAEFISISEGLPIPKGEGEVMAFGTSVNGGSADADCDSVTWLFLDNDAAGSLEGLLELLDMIDASYIAQRRGEKWHLHLPLATPISVPQPFDPAWKKEHVARMEWATGVFSELAGLTLDTNAKKKIYGFDAAIPSIRVLGICYPYARRLPEDEIPETRYHEGRALDLGQLLAVTGFEYSPSTGTPRPVSRDEVQGRLKALMLAGLVREEFTDGKAAVICPWSTDITKHGHEPGSNTATALLPNGAWKCFHETCSGRTWRDVDTWLADNKPEAHEAAWQSQITYNDKGAPKTSIHNILVILEHDPAWKGLLRFDERAGAVVVTRDPPWGETRTYSDAFITHAAAWLGKRWGIEGYDLVAKGIEAIAQKHSFDPVNEYVNGLSWDGKSRIDTWLTKYLGADDNMLHREIGKRWLISAVKRGTAPGCQADHMLVLEGSQGIGKTSALRILGGPWYGEITTIHDTAAMERLSGFWIMEMSELNALKRNEVENLKAFLSRKEDSYRAAYGRVVEHRPRRCVFAGTTNEHEYLDDTHNRRMWPVFVRQCDFAGLERDRDQLFAEAAALASAGEVWHITDGSVLELAAEAQRARRYLNPWEDKIAAFLENISVTTMTKVMQIALGVETKDQARHHKEVGRILHGLGWQSRVILRSGHKAQQRFLVHTKTKTSDIRWDDLGGPSLAIIKGGKT